MVVVPVPCSPCEPLPQIHTVPVVVRAASGSVDFKVRGAIGIENLASWQQQEATVIGDRTGSVDGAGYGIQRSAIKFEGTDGLT